MKNIFSLVIGSLISILIASLFIPVSGDIPDKEVVKEISTKVFQIGAYEDKNIAEEYAKKLNAKVINKDNKYYVYLSILSDPENIEHMITYLNDNKIYYYIKNIDTSKTFQEELLKYETFMKETTSDIAFIELNNRIMELYEVLYEN